MAGDPDLPRRPAREGPLVTATRAPHVPVLVDRVAELLAGAPAGVVVDGTVGAGGHARAVLAARLDRHGAARLLGIDRDPQALELARQRLADLPAGAEMELVHAGFETLDALLEARAGDPLAGVLLDLGISSMHVDRPERGFSYRQDGPLDMRMDPTRGPTAADLVNGADPGELARILREYGEERFADRVARAIAAARPLTRTTELAAVVREAIPAATRRTGPHPATRTFQALRIAVNDELAALEATLPRALERLVPGGVCVVIAYHSLEDRLVKRAFAEAAQGCICPPALPVCGCGRTPLVEHLGQRPERPGEPEVARNPRARSARLRAVRRLVEAGP